MLFSYICTTVGSTISPHFLLYIMTVNFADRMTTAILCKNYYNCLLRMIEIKVTKFMELTRSQKNRDDRLSLPNNHEDSVARVLLFLYTGNYKEKEVPSFGVARTSVIGPVWEADEEGLTQSTNCDTSMVEGNIYEQSDPTETAGYDDEEDVLDYCKTSEELILAMEVHAQVYICADKFGLEKLKQYATHKFMLRLESLGRERDEELANGPFRLV